MLLLDGGSEFCSTIIERWFSIWFSTMTFVADSRACLQLELLLACGCCISTSTNVFALARVGSSLLKLIDDSNSWLTLIVFSTGARANRSCQSELRARLN